MNTPSVPLIDWLIHNAPMAKYVLSFSNIQGLSFDYFNNITNFNIPEDFDLGINSHAGSESLLSILSEMYNTNQGHIVTTSGGSEANFLVYYSLLSANDEVIVEQPGYQPLWLTPASFEAKIRFLNRDMNHGFSIDIDRLHEFMTSKTKLIVLTNLHNPSGVCLKRNVLEDISKLASDSDCNVLIDEIFLDGCFNDQKSAFGLPNVIITSSMTKIYGLGGLRTGWILSSEESTKEFQRAKVHTTVGSSFLSEEMSAAALMSARDVLKNRFQRHAKTNFDIMKEWVNENKEIVDWIEPDGGLFCFIKYSNNLNSIDLCEQLLEKHRVLVCPGSYFGLDNFFRLSYNCDEHLLRKALEEIAIFLHTT